MNDVFFGLHNTFITGVCIIQSLKYCHNLRLSISEDMDPVDKDCKLKLARYRRRLQMMLRALYNICGDAMRKALITQQSLLQVDKKWPKLKYISSKHKTKLLFF